MLKKSNEITLRAEELADAIAERRLKNEQRYSEAFRQKCLQSVSKMAAELGNEVTVEVSDEDLQGLVKVTEELRELGYKFRFIEVIDSNDNIKGNKLLISVAHLIEAY